MSGNNAADNAPAGNGIPADAGGTNQGEGNREAARRYNQDQHQFVESGKVEKAAEDAKGQDPAEAAAAEKAGKERAKGFDPQEDPDYRKPGTA